MIIITNFLIKMFIKNSDDVFDSAVRTKYGNFASITGILCNIFLCLIKGIAGFLFNSVAIIADAVNNLSDAGNSIISLVGFIIADKPADEDHPYGHARVEYISCMIVSFVILALGATLFKTSAKKIFNPEELNTSMLAIFVLGISILVKLWMSRFYKIIGKKINSSVIIANSTDSFNDVISTAAVLITTLIAIIFKINLDAYAGCAVALFIIYSGFGILKDTMNNLLGTMPDPALVTLITDKLHSYEGVHGIHDLVVHSYGPDKNFATVHVEVSSKVDILISHDMIDNIERDFLKEYNLNLVIHLDPVITDDAETNEYKEKVLKIVKDIDESFTMHDFRMVKGETHSNLIFDIAIPASSKMPEKELVDTVSHKINELDSKLFAVITVDKSFIPHNH